ncbi:MAG: bifunctional [glutamate--ammonia ligase]-adenylyl-L-tyrosine phosphorylase/[glutamate--ammonia-ligase] adenylyltransferase [Gammaproteobacteria bacterium]|nr:bifunctional [glutamate--ammonia ligase]-adenylyl-L-tyrosine phosphorylase/[glutamate--ammonia-ligase] adenylyltransferase [Gammaproteobacteria bacterium]
MNDRPASQAGLERLAGLSPFSADIVSRYPELLEELQASGRLARPGAPGALRDLLDRALAGTSGDDDFLRRLRLFRHRELVRIVWRDLNEGADVTESLRDLSDLADAAINAALDYADGLLRARHGAPRSEDGQACGPGVIAMGKLGGHELNFSSDVDLVFVFSAAGETDGARALSNEEYFRLLAQRVIDLLSRNTADGFVYRVDVRLRPFGSAGPLAVSVAALENYLLQNGRDWERYAWIKARVVNAWADAEYLYRDVLRPFVYRRYLDYGVFSSLREMKALIEAEVARKEFRGNLKLGPGGIREIEFIAQALQLVRGGTVAPLRERQILKALPALVQAGCLPERDAGELTTAYRFLRLAENRIQALYDRQTHDLPADPADQQRLALAMGFPDWAAFLAALQLQRDTVARHFRDIVFRGTNGAGDEDDTGPVGGAEARLPEAELARVWLDDAAPDVQLRRLAAAGFQSPAEALERVRRLREGGLQQRLDQPGRQRLDALVPAVLRAASRQPEAARALDGMVLVLESIGRRSAYFALLNENPAALQRLVGICAASEFLAQLVATHPLLLDELLDPRVFEQAPSRSELAADLEVRLSRVAADDAEARLDALRNFQQAAIFRVAVVDLTGVLPLMKVSDRLTDIAELVLEAALALAWQELVARHGEPRCTTGGGTRPARFAIVAYGKLGGLELGYGSDLDLVFLNDSEGEQQQTGGAQPLDNAVFFSRLTRRVISILTMHTTSGKLYEVDIRLRPSGQSGLLVSSLTAFDLYQRDDAWTWEHQALLRSRAVAGDAGVKAAFEQLRVKALTTYVRRENLAKEVADMRQRMRDELSKGTPELLDVKQDPGGITDIEFLVQYLVLREAWRYPDLVRWSDNIRQLEALGAHGILAPADAEELAEAYRTYRQRMHHLNLAGAPGLVPRAEAAELVATVVRHWRAVFYTDGPQSAE